MSGQKRKIVETDNEKENVLIQQKNIIPNKASKISENCWKKSKPEYISERAPHKRSMRSIIFDNDEIEEAQNKSLRQSNKNQKVPVPRINDQKLCYPHSDMLMTVKSKPSSSSSSTWSLLSSPASSLSSSSTSAAA